MSHHNSGKAPAAGPPQGAFKLILGPHSAEECLCDHSFCSDWEGFNKMIETGKSYLTNPGGSGSGPTSGTVFGTPGGNVFAGFNSKPSAATKSKMPNYFGIYTPTLIHLSQIGKPMKPPVFYHPSIAQDFASFLITPASSSNTPCVKFNPVAYVESLLPVDISTIADEDNKCPHCWLPFGVTGENYSGHIPYAPSAEIVAANSAAFAELPHNQIKDNKDPVITPCGHIFGRSCLTDSLQKVATSCPICKKEFDVGRERLSNKWADNFDGP